MFQLLIKNGNGYSQLQIEGDGGLMLETNNPLEYEFGKTSKTYSITIKNVGNNNILLDNIFYKSRELNVVFDDVYYLIENNIYLKGVLKIYSYNAFDAKAQFISYNTILLNRLKSTNLNELDFSELNHELNRNNIINSESLNLFDGNIIYDLIDRGKTREHQQTEDASIDGVSNIIINSVDVSERFPAIKLDIILKKIFDGYQIIGNFFELDFYNYLYYIYVNDFNELSNTDDFIILNKFKTTLNNNFTTQTEFTSSQFGFNVTYDLNYDNVSGNLNNGFDVNTNTFTVQEDGVYEINYFVRGTATVSGTGVGLAFGNIILNLINDDTDQIILNNTIPHIYINNILPTPTNVGEFGISIGTGKIFLEAGRKFRTSINFTATVNASSNWTRLININRGGTFFSVEPSTSYGLGSMVEVSKMMPSLNINDFLKSILREFNVELFINNENNIIEFNIRKFNETAIDLSKYILNNTINILTEPDTTNYLFKHKLDNNDIHFKTLYDKDKSINGEYLFNTNAVETTSFISEFSRTLMTSVSRWGVNETGRIWTQYLIPNLNTQFNQRLLLLGDLQPCNYNLNNIINGSFIKENRTTFRVLNNLIPQFNYSFAGDLFNRFHRNNIENKVFGYTVEVDLELPQKIISNLYYLTNNYWLNSFYINTVNVKGYFVLIKLDNLYENIYRGRFYYITNIDSIGEFSDDFFTDFNI